MKRFILFSIITFLFYSFSLFSQTQTNVEALKTLSKEKAIEYTKKKAEALKYADDNAIPVRFEANKTQFELQYIDEAGSPIYYITHNANAAATISTNKVYSGGGAGLSLSGTGITVREWDAGNVRASHQEFGSRVTNVNSVSTHYHSTHVAGTIMAAGVVSNAKGMAYAATLRAFDWNNDASEMASEASAGALLSNHSYGFGRGWTWTGSSYTWYGNSSISSTEDYQFGFYNSYSQSYDQIAYNAPNYLICVSAGNDRNEGPNSSPPNDGPYDCMADYAVSKNTLTIGAVNDIPGGYTSPSSVTMSSFSSWGPVDDGRIKPDIVANGVSLYSTDNASNTAYQYLSGTSMSSPSATGSLALLQQHYHNLTGTYMRSATLKALVIHTADEAGSYTGPDYQFGWGLMNTKNAALKISEDQTLNVLSEHILSNGGTYTRTVTALGTEPLKVTIVWTDYPGTPVSAQLDPLTPMIKNDLDLRLIKGGSTYYPWKLNRNSPASAATNSGENNVDNVEVVYIANPTAGASYTITVDHDGTLTNGSQAFSVIISGISSVMPPVADFNASNLYPPGSLTTVTFTDQSTNNPTTWSWSFVPNTVTYVSGNSTSQNLQVRFNNPGAYTVSLYVQNSAGNDTETKTDYIHVGQPGLWTGNTSTSWNTKTNWENGAVPLSTTGVSITPAAIRWPTKTGNLIIGTDCNSLNMSSGYTELTVTGNLAVSSGKTFYVDPTGNPNIYVGGGWSSSGTFTPGLGKVILNGSSSASLNANGSNNLTTMFASTVAAATSNYFDISPSGGADITINAFDINCSTTGTVSVEVWYRTSTYVGNTGSSAGWMKIGSTQTVTGQGTDNATHINLSSSVTIPNGSVNGFFISCYTTAANFMAVTAGNNTYSDSYITVQCGEAATAKQPGNPTSYTGYTWNGTVYYSYTGGGSLSFWDFEVNRSNAKVVISSNTVINNNLTINPTSNLTLDAGKILTVNGLFTNMSGASGFVIKSDASGTASLLHNMNGVDATVERYLTDARWHFIGIPVSSATAGVFHLPAGHSDIYLRTHIEATNSWDSYIVPVTTPLALGRGYETWVGDPQGFSQPETIEFAGILNSGDYTTGSGGFYGLQYTPGRGLNMIANPYPSALQGNINTWSKNNVVNSLWTWSKAFGNYVYWGSGNDYGGGNYGTMTGGVIPAMQGFFVEATDSNPWLTIPQSDRIHSNQAYYKDSFVPENTLQLGVTGNDYKDVVFVSFNEQATEGYDSGYDVQKLFGLEEAPQLYSVIPNRQLSINTLPELTESGIVQLGFECGAEGLFTFTADHLESFIDYTPVYLEDTKEGTIQKLNDNPVYVFNHNPLDEKTRFVLHFGEVNGIGDLTTGGINIYSNKNVVYVKMPVDFTGNISIFDMLGQEIITQKASGEGLMSIPVTNGTGYYVVKVQSDNSLVTRKVFIK